MAVRNVAIAADYVARDGLGDLASESSNLASEGRSAVPTSKLFVFRTAVLVRLAPCQREKHRSSRLGHRVISRGKRNRIAVLDAGQVSHAGLHFQIGG